jgi:hypothetical protein
MLNGSDVQLFYKLLDSLSSSLRDLAVKYEVLLRESAEREKVTSAVSLISKELSGTFALMAQDIKLLKDMATNGEANGDDVFTSVQSSIKAIEGLNVQAGQILKEIGLISGEVSGVVANTKHLDSHMDTTSGQISELLGISQKMSSMIVAVEEMKEDFKPIKRLSILLSKPIMVIVGIYFIIATILAIMKGCDEYDNVTSSIRTNSVSLIESQQTHNK